MEEVSVACCLGQLLHDPLDLLRRWNAKAAVLSAIFRGAIFLLAAAHSPVAGRAVAALAEAVYGAVNAGFCGTLTQALRAARPRWLAIVLLAAVFPLFFQAGELGWHRLLGQHAAHASLLASAGFTALSALFNLYVMRRGALLVGAEGQPFLHDLCRLPRLAVSFVGVGVGALVRLPGQICRGR